MQLEATRLAQLVQELIDLSRLQGDDPLPSAEPVVRRRARRRGRRPRPARPAEPAGIIVVAGGERRLAVRGDEAQLVTALGNLVDNAVAY